MSPPGLTIRELADLLELPVDYVRRLADRGIIATLNCGFGTKRFVPVSELHTLRARGFTVSEARVVQSVQSVQDRCSVCLLNGKAEYRNMCSRSRKSTARIWNLAPAIRLSNPTSRSLRANCSESESGRVHSVIFCRHPIMTLSSRLLQKSTESSVPDSYF